MAVRVISIVLLDSSDSASLAPRGKAAVARRQTALGAAARVRYHRRKVDAERGIRVTIANIRMFFITVAVLALLVLAFLLAAPALG